jgi:hypothetical protein
MYAIFVLIKVYTSTFLRVLQNSIIEIFWASKLDRKICASEDIKVENERLQNKFWQIFKNYEECARCKLHCCFGRVNRFDYVDCFLNCFPLYNGQSEWHKISHLTGILSKPRKLIQFGDTSLQNCIYHSDQTGCTLAVGERPLMCITGVCFKFLQSLNHQDIKECSRLINKSISFHFKCFFLLCAKLFRNKRSF